MAITDPRDIPGLQGWYSAEAETSYADGAEMTQWTDLSGLGNHLPAVAGSAGAKPLWQATTGSGGGPAVRFQSTHRGTDGGYFTFPSGYMGAATAGELLAQIKSDGVDCSQWLIGTSGNSTHYPFGSAIYESFGLASGFYNYTPTMAITTWRRYNVRAATNDFSAHLDGTSQATKASGTVAWGTVSKLGRNAYGMAGHMSCVVLYGRVLTTAERSDLEAWMTANPSGGTAGGGGGGVTVVGEPAVAAAVALDRSTLVPVVVVGEPAVAAATAVDGSVLLFTGTDLSNGLEGIRIEGGTIHIDNTDPVVLPPAAQRTVREDVAIAYPTPDLVNGRPT